MCVCMCDVAVYACMCPGGAGGVKTAQDAQAYLKLADKMLGPEWADARHFRFGASSLRPALLSTLQGGDGAAASSGY